MENLKGYVKTVTEYCYDVKFKHGRPIKRKICYWKVYHYDRRGNEISDSELDADGFYACDTNTHTHWYKYDSLGRIVLMYEEPTFVSDSTIDTSKGYACKFVNIYDGKGDKALQYFYGCYGDGGKIIQVLDYKSLFKYDTSGNMIEQDDYENGKKLAEKIVDSYDDKGCLVKSILYYPIDTICWMNMSKYDSAGNEIEATHYEGTKFDWHGVTTFDDKSNELKDNMYSEKGTLLLSGQYSYEYDKTGNWTKEWYYADGKLKVIERAIEYY